MAPDTPLLTRHIPALPARHRRPHEGVRYVGALALAWICSGAGCAPAPERPPLSQPATVSSDAPVVRVAFGWSAHEVERASTASVGFSDQDVGSVLVEHTPTALSYAEPAHAFTLPPGRFLRVNQAAGRVYDASATPHLEALTREAAVALADSVTRLLEYAGWARVPGEGRGPAAVADAERYARDGAGGVGVAQVGAWRIPRPAAAWAARPRDAPPRPGRWDGVTAVITVHPVRAVTGSEPVTLILEVQLSDDLLGSALFAMTEARRARLGGDMQTLRSWVSQPAEPIAVGARP